MTAKTEMQKTMQIFKPMLLLLGFLLLLLLLFSYSDRMQMSAETCLLVAVGTIVITLVYCFFDISNRFILLSFNFTYFVFLLGGLFVTFLNGNELSSYLDVSEQAATHTCYCLAASILVVDIVSVLFSHAFTGSKKESPLRGKGGLKKKPLFTVTKGTEQVIFIIFLCSLIGKLGGALIQYRFLLHHTYVDSYIISYDKPTMIWMMESIFYFSLCLWLSTKPKKKLFLVVLALIVVVELLVLFSGDRGEPMAALFMLLYYVYKRSKQEEDFIRITKGKVLIALALVPVLIISMQVVKQTRSNEDFEMTESVFEEFMQDQGVSCSVIAKGYAYKDTITSIGGKSYTFGSLRGYLGQNRISRMLFGTVTYPSNSVQAAMSGDSFGSTLAYLWFRESFLSGIGCGSSYIAELVHDGGMAQLCIGSAVLAFIILFLCNKLQNTNSVLRSAFFLLLCKQIITLPRANCFAWLYSTFSTPNLLILGGLFVVNMLFSLYGDKKEISV